MPFLTQGKTNWKFIGIAAVPIIIIGFFGWQWWAWKIAPDKHCEQVDDCVYTCGCGCINKDSICKFPFGMRISCKSFECDCVDNQCVEKQTKIPIDGIANWKICSVDSDCIIVDGDCCGCTSGGTATTISKELKEKWEEKLLKKCKEVECLDVISDDPSCFKKPKCINNVCQLVEDEIARCIERYPLVEFESCVPGEVVDGWSIIILYPNTIDTSSVEYYSLDMVPDTVRQTGVASYGISQSLCEVIWSIKVDGEWKEVGQIEFCNHIIDYNSFCDDCLLEWEGGCC